MSIRLCSGSTGLRRSCWALGALWDVGERRSAGGDAGAGGRCAVVWRGRGADIRWGRYGADAGRARGKYRWVRGASVVTRRAVGVTGRADRCGSGRCALAMGGRCGAVRVRTGRCVTARLGAPEIFRGRVGVHAESGCGGADMGIRHARGMSLSSRPERPPPSRSGKQALTAGCAGSGNRVATQFVWLPGHANIIQW